MNAVEVGVLVALGVAIAGLALVALAALRAERREPADPPWTPASPDTSEPRGDDFRALALERLVSVAATVTGAAGAALYARDEARVNGAVEVTSYGKAGGLMGIAAVVLRSGRPALVGDGRTAAAVPVMWRGRQDAVLVVAAGRARGPLDGGDLELLFELAGRCGTALDHRSLHGASLDSTMTQASALQTAAAVWEGFDPARGDALAGLAREIGCRLGLRGSELDEVELGARLHDVGKLRVPGAVLRRGGPLNVDEYERVRMHPLWSAELVSRVPGLEAVAALVSFHHERADGHGYPHALPAERIPLASRIIAVCDAYSALRSERPYREALSQDAALAELRSSDGQFDPFVLDALGEHVTRAPTYA